MNVTNVIRIKPFQNKEEETLDWMAKMAVKASEMKGYVNTEILETNRRISEKEFLTILQFDTKENLDNWQNDSHRKNQMEWVTNNLADINNVDFFENMGFWDENKNTNQQSPNRLKVYLLAVTVIFTLITTLAQHVLTPLGVNLGTPPLLMVFLNVATLVALVSFVIMPFLVKKLFKFLV